MSKKSKSLNTSRRGFLKGAAALSAGALSFPYIIPSSALGKDGAVAPSNRIVMGGIGTGGRGGAHLDAFSSNRESQVVAVADVDRSHLANGVASVNSKYGNDDCKGYGDFNELLTHKDIQAVFVAVPDHWHALASVAALNAGKHVYCEKPLANSIYEGRKVVDAVAKNKRIFQTGSQERSGSNSRYVAELIRSGGLGKLKTMYVNLPFSDGHLQAAKKFQGIPPERKVPEGFDYDRWLGHTPLAPYCPERTHFMWRFILDYGGGEMTDRGAHVIDIGQMCNNSDDTGPVEIEAKGVQTPGSLYNVFWDYNFTNTYANGVTMIGSCAADRPRGIKFEGTDGWVHVEIHGGALKASKPELLDQAAQKKNFGDKWVDIGRVPGEQGGHQNFFVSCVKANNLPYANAEVGHRTASICHLNNIAMKVGGKLKWDPAKEEFIGNDEANKLVKPSFRAPYLL